MSAELRTVEFEQLAPIDEDEHVPKGLHIRLSCAPEQHASEGLQFQVTLANDASRSRKLHNPYDVLTYVLADAAGWPIGATAPASRLKLNPKRSNVGRRREYLDVVGISIGNEQLDTAAVAEELEKNTVTVDGGQQYCYHLAIRQAHPSHEHPDLVPLAPGDYAVRATLLVRTATFRPASAVLQTVDVAVTLR